MSNTEFMILLIKGHVHPSGRVCLLAANLQHCWTVGCKTVHGHSLEAIVEALPSAKLQIISGIM